LAKITQPLQPLLHGFFDLKLTQQVFGKLALPGFIKLTISQVRLGLALSNAASLIYFARHLPRRISSLFLLYSACQFHLPFWAGRTIPNMVAFGFVQVALVKVLLRPRGQHIGFTMLALSACVFRGDLLPVFLSLLPFFKWRSANEKAYVSCVLFGCFVLGAFH
jgi:hypothetical protein